VKVSTGWVHVTEQRKAGRVEQPDIFSRLDRIADPCTGVVSLSDAAFYFTEAELDRLLEKYGVVYIHSSRPALVLVK
jgi:hypothetical protein